MKLLASYYDLFNNLWLSRNIAQIDRWVDPDFSLPALPPGAPRGPQLLANLVGGVKAAFPKRHIFNDVVLCGDGADGDTVDTARQLGWVLLAPGETRPGLASIPWIDRYPHAK